MVKLTFRHEFDCTVDAFWKLFFDKDFTVALFKEGLEFQKFEVVEQRETDTEIHRTVSAAPKLDLPGPVAKLLGPGFAYMEEGTFDKAAKRWRWTMIPGSLKDKLKQSGTLRVEEVDGGKCRRVAELEAEAKVFGIGGMVEGVFEKQLRTGWDKSADFMRRWMKEKGIG